VYVFRLEEYEMLSHWECDMGPTKKDGG
jgi:hypothetical protein